jgi:hypothetical protein
MSEFVVIGFILAFAAWIAAAVWLSRGGLWRVSRYVSLAWAAIGALLVGVALASRIPVALPPEPDVPIEVVDDEYQSSSSCRACHPDQYASWHRSYHRTMTQIATPDSVIGDFSDVQVRFGDARFRLFEADGEYFGEMDAPNLPGGLGARRVTVPVKQTTGSHHMQLYWYPTGNGRSLGIFPLVFLRDQQRWIPRRAAFIAPPGPTPNTFGLWNHVCIECHSTHARPRISESGIDTQVTELGIACEACHGPGAEHIEANQSPVRRYRMHFSSESDPTVVNPAELPHVRSAQVCGQCHSAKTMFNRKQVIDWRQNGSSFRPGDDLDKTANIISNANLSRPSLRALVKQKPDFLRSTFWPDGVVRVSGREYNALLETGCFTRGEMSCLSCHTLHKAADDPRDLAEWADDMLAPEMETNRACTQCHEGFDEDQDIARHTNHAPDSSGSQCQNCHMPYTNYGLLKAIRSHRIDSPDLATELEVGRPNACNQCHLDRSLGWSADALARWYDHEPPELTEDERRISAGVRWALEGDAAVRALAAWSMGWPVAREAAGSSWQLPYLAELMNDPYDAVRIIAYRSLKTFPGFETAEFDEFETHEQRADAIAVITERWARLSASSGLHAWLPGRGERTLFDSQGELETGTIERLLERRDLRPLELFE